MRVKVIKKCDNPGCLICREAVGNEYVAEIETPSYASEFKYTIPEFNRRYEGHFLWNADQIEVI